MELNLPSLSLYLYLYLDTSNSLHVFLLSRAALVLPNKSFGFTQLTVYSHLPPPALALETRFGPDAGLLGMSGIATACLSCLSAVDRWCHITACLGPIGGRSRDGIYETTLADNEREAVSDLLGYLENVRATSLWTRLESDLPVTATAPLPLPLPLPLPRAHH